MPIYKGNETIRTIWRGNSQIKSVWKGLDRVYPSAGLETTDSYAYGTVTGPNVNGSLRYQENIPIGQQRYFNSLPINNAMRPVLNFNGNLRGFSCQSAGSYYIRYMTSVVSLESKTDSVSLFNNYGEYSWSAKTLTCPAGYTNNIFIETTASLSVGDVIWWGWKKSNYWDGTFSTHFMAEKI